MEKQQNEMSEENMGAEPGRDGLVDSLLPILGVVLAGVLLFLISGGIPPTAWRLLLSSTNMSNWVIAGLFLQWTLVYVTWVVLGIALFLLLRRWFAGRDDGQEEWARETVDFAGSSAQPSTEVSIDLPVVAESHNVPLYEDMQDADVLSSPAWVTVQGNTDEYMGNHNNGQVSGSTIVLVDPENSDMSSEDQAASELIVSGEAREARQNSRAREVEATQEKKSEVILPLAVPGVLSKVWETSSAWLAEGPIYIKNELSGLMAKRYGPLTFPLVVGYICHPIRKEASWEAEDSIFLLRGARKESDQPAGIFELFVLADGVSDVADREPTSRQASGRLGEILQKALLETSHLNQESVSELLLTAMKQVGNELYERNVATQSRSLTCLLVALLLDSTLYIANVGENRAYLYRQPEGLVRITFDHSQVSERYDEGELDAEEIYRRPREAQFGRSMGMQKQVECDILAVDVQPGDLLLFCSDGLWKLIPPTILARLVELENERTPFRPERFCKQLLQQALIEGELDRLSLVVAQMQEE